MTHAYTPSTSITWSWPILQRHGTGVIKRLEYDFGLPEYPIYVVELADGTEVILDSWYTIEPIFDEKKAGKVAA